MQNLNQQSLQSLQSQNLVEMVHGSHTTMDRTAELRWVFPCGSRCRRLSAWTSGWNVHIIKVLVRVAVVNGQLQCIYNIWHLGDHWMYLSMRANMLNFVLYNTSGVNSTFSQYLTSYLLRVFNSWTTLHWDKMNVWLAEFIVHVLTTRWQTALSLSPVDLLPQHINGVLRHEASLKMQSNSWAGGWTFFQQMQNLRTNKCV